MDAWTFIWLMLLLKIPIVGLFLIVRWALRQEPDPLPEEGGGSGPRPRHPHRPRPRYPHIPRRGPHRGERMPLAPPRIRTVAARGRVAPH
ncbi:MAG TPA: hypothetical protein VIC05_09575 [Solirubrobacteraceae bacterium]